MVPGPLAQRVLLHDPAELGQQLVVAPQRQLDGGGVVVGVEPVLTETAGLLLDEQPGNPGERGPAPQVEGAPVPARRVLQALLPCVDLRLGDECGELHRVDVVALGVEEVARMRGHDGVVGRALRLERLAERGDDDGDLGTGGGGRIPVPHFVHQSVHRHGSARVEQQQSERGPLTCPADDHLSLARRHHEWAKDFE